jgi:hypothetical protein
MIKTENFVISFEDREYQCLREVKSGEVTTQKIFVKDVGSKEDSHPYSAAQINSMEAAARQIAGELIEETQLVEEPLNPDQ